MVMKNKLKHRNQWYRYRSTNLLIGFICSISFCLTAFNYTSYSVQRVDLATAPEIIDETLDIIPTVFPKPKKKFIPIPPIIDIQDKIEPNDEVDIKEDMPTHFEPNSSQNPQIDTVFNDAVLRPEPESKAPIVAPVKKETPTDNEPIFFADHMPYYGDCHLGNLDKRQRKECSDNAFLQYLKKTIRYPGIAVENRIEGVVFIEIILAKDGSLESTKVLKDIGGGCGKEALRAINNMGNWSPAKHRGRPVRLIMRLPVKFELAN